MKTPSEKQLLEYKKARFLSAVEASAKYLSVPVPEVKFWKDYDSSHFHKGERAHIHSDTKTICIAEPELEIMDEDEIKETASHEVNHIMNLTHDIDFQNKRIDTQASLFRPPTGTVGAAPEGTSRIKDNKDLKEKPDKRRCNYHQCRRRGRNYQCKFCKGYFCKKHRKPKLASMFLSKDTSPRSMLLMEEYHKKNAHPCIPYSYYFEEMKKKEKDKWGETLDILSGKNKGDEIRAKRIREGDYIVNHSSNKSVNEDLRKIAIKNLNENSRRTIKQKTKENSRDYNKKPRENPINQLDNNSSKKKINFFRIISIVIIILIVVCVFFYFKYQQIEYSKLPKCYDGTLYGKCSLNKPNYCYEGKLVEKAATCGCPRGYSVDFQGCEIISNSSSEKNIINSFMKGLNKLFSYINSTYMDLKNNLSTQEIPKSKSDVNYVENNPGIQTIIETPKSKIDDVWVHNFMSIVNNERAKKGLSTMQESNQLDTIANERFNKMMENPFISHYGADAYNVGEVVFYPEGYGEEGYAIDIQQTASLHWDLLMDPIFSSYGYHIEEGPTLGIIGSCPITEIPGPNIDEKEFFSQRGCQTITENSMWLVIDMI